MSHVSRYSRVGLRQTLATASILKRYAQARPAEHSAPRPSVTAAQFPACLASGFCGTGGGPLHWDGGLANLAAKRCASGQKFQRRTPQPSWLTSSLCGVCAQGSTLNIARMVNEESQNGHAGNLTTWAPIFLRAARQPRHSVAHASVWKSIVGNAGVTCSDSVSRTL